MNRGLVVMEDSTAHRNLLREAAETAGGGGGDLVLLTLLDASKYERDVETLESIGDVENVSYGEGTISEGAEQETDRVARETLGDEFDVNWGVIVDVVSDDERARTIVEAAVDNDCDHVFLLGRRRSPTGKALFGDVAQRVILNFQGYVTLSTQ